MPARQYILIYILWSLLVMLLKRRTDGCAGCTEDGRDGRIRATEYTGGNGTQKRGGSVERSEEKGRCGTYNVGVKDLASAYVLCPCLAECGGLSIYGRDKVLWNNEGIGSQSCDASTETDKD